MARYIVEVEGENNAGYPCARWFAVEAENEDQATDEAHRKARALKRPLFTKINGGTVRLVP